MLVTVASGPILRGCDNRSPIDAPRGRVSQVEL
ncbi:MAG: hypothetical protein QOD72_2466, partial [Acidimicrobiaceae bacterium]|nr:hypothetical protein [Acidimicrobiaceae bacterium]